MMVTRKSMTMLTTATVLSLGLVVSTVPAQASTAFAPQSSAAVSAEVPIQGAETPAQAATRQYSRDVALSILQQTVLPKAGSLVDQTDPNVVNLVQAKKAGAKPIGGVSRTGTITYAQTTYQSGLVLVNTATTATTQVISVTGGSYTLAGNSGLQSWVPKGGIATKWTSLGGATKVGLPIIAEYSGVAGVHVGATPYAAQKFSTSSGAQSDLIWSSRYGTKHVKGAIGASYWANGGPRTQGVPTGDEVRNADGSVTQRYERVTISYINGKIVRR